MKKQLVPVTTLSSNDFDSISTGKSMPSWKDVRRCAKNRRRRKAGKRNIQKEESLSHLNRKEGQSKARCSGIWEGRFYTQRISIFERQIQVGRGEKSGFGWGFYMGLWVESNLIRLDKPTRSKPRRFLDYIAKGLQLTKPIVNTQLSLWVEDIRIPIQWTFANPNTHLEETQGIQ